MSTPLCRVSTWGTWETPPKMTGAAQMGVAAVGVEALLDLQSELPGGGEDEGANRPGSPQRLPVDPANRIFCQALEDRQCERRRFAGPGLGAATRSRPSNTGGMAFS